MKNLNVTQTWEASKSFPGKDPVRGFRMHLLRRDNGKEWSSWNSRHFLDAYPCARHHHAYPCARLHHACPRDRQHHALHVFLSKFHENPMMWVHFPGAIIKTTFESHNPVRYWTRPNGSLS